jgi:hypothetical protein
MILIHCGISDFQRRRLMAEDGKLERGIELLGCGLIITYCKDYLFEVWDGLGAP